VLLLVMLLAATSYAITHLPIFSVLCRVIVGAVLDVIAWEVLQVFYNVNTSGFLLLLLKCGRFCLLPILTPKAMGCISSLISEKHE
jgi:hypothetical protein